MLFPFSVSNEIMRGIIKNLQFSYFSSFNIFFRHFRDCFVDILGLVCDREWVRVSVDCQSCKSEKPFTINHPKLKGC